MSSLTNPKYEKFAQCYIKNEGKWKKTMEEAGYTVNRSYFAQLKNRDIIKARIKELYQTAIVPTVMQLTERLEKLTEIINDPESPRLTRIKALHELHHQSGDDITKIDLNSHNEVKIVEVLLPTKPINEENQDPDVLNGFDNLLKD